MERQFFSSTHLRGEIMAMLFERIVSDNPTIGNPPFGRLGNGFYGGVTEIFGARLRSFVQGNVAE
jgi:hypothetical protein